MTARPGGARCRPGRRTPNPGARRRYLICATGESRVERQKRSCPNTLAPLAGNAGMPLVAWAYWLAGAHEQPMPAARSDGPLRWRHTIADDKSASPRVASRLEQQAQGNAQEVLGACALLLICAVCAVVLSCALSLLIGLCRMEKLTWLKFSVKLLPVPALTFEISAVSKLGKLPEVDGRRQHPDNQPDSLPKFARDAHGAPTKSDGCSSAEGTPDRGLSGRCGRLCRECCTWGWRA